MSRAFSSASFALTLSCANSFSIDAKRSSAKSARELSLESISCKALAAES